MTPFYGKYRGVVTDVQDPLQFGRIRARVTDLGERELGWAMPCFPFAGSGMGLFALPKVDSGVWIEFEHGDTEHPIWSGCWYGGQSEVPSALQSPPYKKVLLKTEAGHSIVLDDSSGSGGITLETSGGRKISLTSQGIEIDNGSGVKITLQGSQVNVNNGALEVA